ncbi:MAG: hypothetical protein ACLRFG_01770 [Clostridia bacterium]
MYHTKRTTGLNIANEKLVRNHKIKSKSDVYRLHYVRFAPAEAKDKEYVSWEYAPFRMPQGIDREEFFALMSYLRDYVAVKHDVRATSLEGVKVLNTMLDQLGLSRVTDATDIITLFVVEGDQTMFNKSPFAMSHHRWYKKGISREQAQEISAKCGLSLDKI